MLPSPNAAGVFIGAAGPKPLTQREILKSIGEHKTMMALRLETIAEQIKALDISEIMSVYSGKRNRCACGCSGKHRYALAHRDTGSKNRGYEVGDDEINDAQVRRIFNILQANADKAESFGTGYSFDTENRMYIIYLLPQ